MTQKVVTNESMMKRSMGKQFFFAIFGTFGRYLTNLRGTALLLKVEKSQKSVGSL
jgi:hypothetical protein